jgi:hypothetical protein
MIKCTLILVLILSFYSTSVFSQEDISDSKWQAEQIVIDGNNADWSHPMNFFDNSSGLIFTMTNDTKNLYLCFSNNDKLKTGKMMLAGWSIELVSSEKKRKFDAVITFPKSVNPNINRQSDLKTAIGVYKAEVQNVKTKGFITDVGEIPLINKDGINIAIGEDATDKIIYEIKIPYKELVEEDKIQFNEVISLDITVNSMERPTEKPSGSAEGRSGYSGGGEHMGGGGRGGGGGGRGGGRSGGYSGERQGSTADQYAMFDKVSFKQKIKLVKS